MLFVYRPNFGFSLVEAGIAILAIILIVIFSVNIFYKEERILGKILKQGSAITSLIIFGIIFGIKVVFEILGVFSPLFRMLNNDQMFFAVAVSLFFPLHRPLINKFGYAREAPEDDTIYSNFRKFWLIFVIIAWIIAGFFLSFQLLRIPFNNPDIFNLGILWTAGTVFINVIITSIINRTLTMEKRIAKTVLRNTMYFAGLIAFGLWSLQLIVFEVYLNRWLGVLIFKQDIRVTIIVVSGLYTVFFINLLKTKFLPESSEKGSKRVKKLLESELERQLQYGNNADTEMIHDTQQKALDLEIEAVSFRAPEGIAFKLLFYFSKKTDKNNLSDEELVTRSFLKKKFNIIIAGVLWALLIITFVVSILIRTNPIGQVLFLSCLSAFFMVVGDFGIILLFNIINPHEIRISKTLLQNIIVVGGILSCWVWLLPSYIIYTYVFIWLNDPFIMFITSEVIYSAILFFIGAGIVRWYAGSVKMWNTSKKKANQTSLVWFIVDLPIRLFLLFDILLISLWGFFLTPGWIAVIKDLMITILNIIIGIFIVKRIYKRKISDSLRFAIGVQLILLMVSVFLKHMRIGTLTTGGGLLGFFDIVLSFFNFVISDMRIPLLIGTLLYMISIYITNRIKFTLEPSEEVQEKLIEALKLTGEEDLIEVTHHAGNNVILDVKDLTTYFYTEEGVVKAVEGVSFQIKQGETLGLVGETGCGKSVTALSILKLVRPPGVIENGQVYFEGEDLHQKSPDEFLRYRGNRITMIFQDPLNSLNPVFKIGDQISEVYRLHLEDELLIEAVKKNTSIYDIARKWSQRMLKDLNIPTPRVIFDRYPHELSGGMRQRVQIAMGLACSPRLLIADEPTTALDVTIQNQILKLMKDLKKKYNTSILFITHDLGIISKMCDRVAVMYSGFIVEYGDINKLFRTPYHPYARGLISAVPVVGKRREVLDVIRGTVPNLIYPPSGCRFHPRCEYCFEPCDSEIPRSIEIEPKYFVACHLYDPKYKDLAEISIKKVENQEFSV
ncbi:MAG: ABC transporter ATP-binding protein [Candidatus Thorarchaeota archaeon]